MKFNILDAFRGLAALWVFTFHLSWNSSFKNFFPFLENLFSNGSLGVQMFFIISGYCVMSSLRQSIASNEKPYMFIFRRSKRIYVTFWFSIVFVAIIPFIIEFISSFKTGKYISPFTIEAQSYEYLQFSFFEWVKTISLVKIFDSPLDRQWLSDKFNPINSVYWSLAIEMQFYLIMFIGLCLKTRIYLFLAVVTAISIIAVAFLQEYHLSGLFVYYWHFFAIGILINTLFYNKIKPSTYEIYKNFFQILFCIITSILIYLLFNIDQVSPVLFAGFFAILIWLVESFELRYINLLSKRNIIVTTFNLLGLFSYSIYLIHAKLLLLVEIFVRQVISENTIMFNLISLSITLVGCYLFYLVCEKPFYRRKVQ